MEKKTTEDEDFDLLTAYVAGDQKAFATLVRKYQRPVYRIALRYARDTDEAEELAQRTFLRVLDHAGKIKKQGRPFRAFLFLVAANLCKNHLRDRAKLIFGVPLSIAVPDKEPIEKKQEIENVRRALARLSYRQRQVVTLRIDAELTFAEIAQSLDMTENNAKVTYHQAVKRLRTFLPPEMRKEVTVTS